MPRASRRLARPFYARPAVDVACDLLGKYLVHCGPPGQAAGRIVEVEAYVGPHDLACHASRGVTRRTQVIFGPPGHAYVYLIYGTSCMFNVICERDGYPAAVLVRALEPAEGVAADTDGPGKLARALGITLRENGCDLIGDRLFIEERRRDARAAAPIEVAATPRINVHYAAPPWAEAPLRFVDASSHWLSRKLPGAPRRTGPRRPAAA